MQVTRQVERFPRSHPRHATRPRSGAVLLEVILALSLFVFAASVITSSLNTAVERAYRLREQMHALDLAVSVLSEIEMGMRSSQSAGPEPFAEPFELWTWEVESAPYSFGTEDVAGLQIVNVIVRNSQSSTVQRLTEILSQPAPAMDGVDTTGGKLTEPNSAVQFVATRPASRGAQGGSK